MSQDTSTIPMLGRPRISLTQQATQALRRRLGQPPFSPGAQLPAEPDLAEAMGVSRATLRSALKNLEAEGMIVRRPGVGTFVSRLPILQNNLNVNSSVADAIRSMGLSPGLQHLAVRLEVADELASASLHLDAGAPVVVAERVRTADGAPVVFSLDFFDARLLERSTPLSLDEFARRLEVEESIYRLFEDELDLRVAGGVARVKPVLAHEELAQRLQVAAGAPLLYLEQVDHDWEQKPLLLSQEYHAPDLCTFTIHRAR
jgi:GntR family transcriptional regulator